MGETSGRQIMLVPEEVVLQRIKQERERIASMVKAGAVSGGPFEFMECAGCAAKPGAPTLCKTCIHNRDIPEAIGAMIRESK